MPVFALYNFDETGTTVRDSALGNGAQDGFYLNGAQSIGGRLVLDGVNDYAKVYSDPSFQLSRGTVEITFTVGEFDYRGQQTVLSRDGVGQHDGSLRVQIDPDGTLSLTQETGGNPVVFTSGPGFFSPCDTISLSYSFDEGGAGGALVVKNTSTGGLFQAAVPDTVSLAMEGPTPVWTVGSGQQNAVPGDLFGINQYFTGTVEVFSLSDSVDNLPAERDGIVQGTEAGDLIDTAYVDPFDGDRIDANDALIGGDAPNDDRVRAGDGDDTVRAAMGDDTVWAGRGDDVVFGQDGDDDLRGDEGNDSLTGGNGRDLAYGGLGDDVIDTSGGATPLPDQGYPGIYAADADREDDRDTVYGGSGNDSITTGDDADLVNGDEGRDTIDGGFDNDTINGGEGADNLIGGEGADRIEGGRGNDLIYGGLDPDTPDPLNIPNNGSDLRPRNDTDNLVGGTGDDTIYGLDDDDTLAGGDGNDVLFGGIDEDLLRGDAGDDTFTGGIGRDTLFGGADRDTFLVGSQADGARDFVNGNEEGDDFDTLDLRGAGPFVITYFDDNPENGRVDFLDGDGNVESTLTFENIENIIPCFTPGTLIATPKGEVPVENLVEGDKVITRDNGIQQIRWVGARALTWADFTVNPHLKPVLVKRGSLGNDLPEQDMLVSPNHRLLVANERTALYFDEHEVLVAAKHLVGAAGVAAIDAIGTTYLHFMFDRHEVVLSNGAWTESFQPGDYTLKGMGNAQRNEIFEIFPELKTDAGLEGYHAARRTLKRHEASLLLR